MKTTLKLNPDDRTEHDAIKLIIDKIRNVANTMQACGYETSQEFIRLKNELGVMVYKDWNYDNQ